MDHQQINRLEQGDPPSVELRIERDGLFVALQFGVSDFAVLPVLLGPWQDNTDRLFGDCNQVILGLLPEAYGKALKIRERFEKALSDRAQVLRCQIDRESFGDVVGEEGDW